MVRYLSCDERNGASQFRMAFPGCLRGRRLSQVSGYRGKSPSQRHGKRRPHPSVKIGR